MSRLRALLLVCACACAACADPVAVRLLIRTAFTDDDVVACEQAAGSVRRPRAGVSLVNDVELRTRLSAFDFQDMRYTLRVEPRGIGETSGGVALDRALCRQSISGQRAALNRALKDRYLLVIDLLEQQAMVDACDTLILIYQDRIAVMEQLASGDNFDLNDLLIAEDQYTRLLGQRSEAQKTLLLGRSRAAWLLGDSLLGSLDTSGFIPPDSAIARVERLSPGLDSGNVHLTRFRDEYLSAEARYRLEKAEARRFVSYLEFSYDDGVRREELIRRLNDKPYDLNQAYALELGISLPSIAGARRDIARRELSYLSDRHSYESLRRELATKVAKDRADISALIGQYQFMKQRESEVDVGASLKKYLQIEGVSPLVLLSTKESLEKNHIAMDKTRYDILRNYVEMLDAAGMLSVTPLVNELSAAREPVSP